MGVAHALITNSQRGGSYIVISLAISLREAKRCLTLKD
jgi:hypothetical protein